METNSEQFFHEVPYTSWKKNSAKCVVWSKPLNFHLKEVFLSIADKNWSSLKRVSNRSRNGEFRNPQKRFET